MGDHERLSSAEVRLPSGRDGVVTQLNRILQSAAFSSAPSLRRLLHHLVMESLDGRSHQLKEYALGVDVFDRGPGFDPKIDTIVRVQARRLRAKLEEYYEEEGAGDELIIELPRGHYVPAWRHRPVQRHAIFPSNAIRAVGVPAATEANRAPNRWEAVRRLGRSRSAAILLGVLAGVLSALVFVQHTRQRQDEPGVLRLLMSMAPGEHLLSAHELDRSPAIGFLRPSRTAIVISPDGRKLVYSAANGERQQLHLRALDQANATPIAGTDGAENPFFSPDGRWIAFWSDGRLQKVRADGGTPLEICRTDRLIGADWGADDAIVYAVVEGPLWRVSAAGGTPAPITSLEEGELSHRLPHVLPGATAVLFTARRHPARWDDASVDAWMPASGERKRIVENATDGRYVASGHLLFVRDGALYAGDFDPEALALTAAPFHVLDNVMHSVNARNTALETGTAQLSVSGNGTLAYLEGGAYPPPRSTVHLVDPSGGGSPLGLPPADFGAPRLSPDGRRLALMVRPPGGQRDVWVYELPAGVGTRLTFEGNNLFPVWTPHGERVTFASSTAGHPNLFWQKPESDAPAERLTTSDRLQLAADWSPDGRTLVFVQRDAATRDDIWALMRDGAGWRHVPIVRSRFAEREPALSPDGRWLAYSSDETGRLEVYVRDFPAGSSRRRISVEGGWEPTWSRDGRRLYYVIRDEGTPHSCTMMVVEIADGNPLSASVPTPLFDASSYLTAVPVRGYDVTADGRFVMIKPEPHEAQPVTHVNIVLNFFEQLARAVD